MKCLAAPRARKRPSSSRSVRSTSSRPTRPSALRRIPIFSGSSAAKATSCSSSPTARRPLALLAGTKTRRAAHTVGEIFLDPHTRVVRVSGVPVKLTKQSYAILLALVRRSGANVSYRELSEILGQRYQASSHAVQTAIVRLRKSLGHAASQVVTEFGVGVRLEANPLTTHPRLRLAKTRPTASDLEEAALPLIVSTAHDP